MAENKSGKQYNADSIRVLRGLEPVKKRPGMYTWTNDPTHIIQEVIDNSGDEALAGYARQLVVTVYRDGSVSVEDNGRGIPVDINKEEGVPAVVLIFTELHSGGKFDKDDTESAYRFSGGLHGVGVSVTNALSTRIEVESMRGGKKHRIVFAGGEVIEPLKVVGSSGGATGTYVRAWPDPQYFDSPDVSVSTLERLLKSKAALLPGVSVIFRKELADGSMDERSWVFPDGLSGYLREFSGMDEDEALPDQDPEAGPMFSSMISGELYHQGEPYQPGEGAAWSVAWALQDAGANGQSFVNLIPTGSGGTHEAGFRQAIFEAIRLFAEHHGLMPKNIRLQPSDTWMGIRYVLSAKVLDPHFHGQTKEQLTSQGAMKMVQQAVEPVLSAWLNSHIDEARTIALKAIDRANTRMKQTNKVEKKKSSGVAVLPGKLTDCEIAGTEDAELFLVEGDSAGGSAKMGRNKVTQALLPLRGKILNTWEVDSGQIFGNAEVHDIFVALGIEPHGINDTPDMSNLRYGKICILSDADVDGSHIQVLLLTLFLRHAPQLIREGHVYIAQPPLYRIDAPAQGKARPARKIYVQDDNEKESVISKLEREGIPQDKLQVQRFKGLGEMNPDQLWETTLCPDTRKLEQVMIPEGLETESMSMFDMLMSKSESSSRKEWMERRGNDIEADV